MRLALAFKELREIAWLGAIAFVLHVVCIGIYIGWWENIDLYLSSDSYEPKTPSAPFMTLDETPLLFFNHCLAIALGLWQTFGESIRKTWLFYLYRPLSRDALILAKVLTGLAMLFASCGIPYVLYALWAATPGTHPHPFEWWMTEVQFRCTYAVGIVYLSTFLCGLRKARWWGSRFWMIIPPLFLVPGIISFQWLPWFGWISLSVMTAMLIGAILAVGRTRDFS